MNQHTKYLGQMSFSSKSVARKDKHEPNRVLCQCFSTVFASCTLWLYVRKSFLLFPRSSDSKDTVQTRSTVTVHTSAEARLTSVEMPIRIRIPDPDRHQNLTICSLAHCQPSLKISCKSVRKLLRKVADKRTDKQTNNDENNLLGGGNNTTTVYWNIVSFAIKVCDSDRFFYALQEIWHRHNAGISARLDNDLN